MSAHATNNVVEIEFGEPHEDLAGLPEEGLGPEGVVPLEGEKTVSRKSARGLWGRLKPAFLGKEGKEVKPDVTVHEDSEKTGLNEAAGLALLPDQAIEATEGGGKNAKGRGKRLALAGALVVAMGGILFWPQEHQTAPIHAAMPDGTKEPQMAPLATLAGVTPREPVPEPVEVRPRPVSNSDVVAEIASLGPSVEDKAASTHPIEVQKAVSLLAVGDEGRSSPVVQEKEPGKNDAAVIPGKKDPRKGISEAEETQVMNMITEVSALVKQTREEIAGLRGEQRKLAEATNAKLADFERRLSFGEARREIENAKVAGMTDTAPVESVTPAPSKGSLMPIKAMAPTPRSSAPKVENASLSSVGQTVIHYRVRAASPNLAMLSTVEESGDESKPVQVAVGEQVPGYGKVKSIAQRGTAWVVLTENGEIR